MKNNKNKTFVVKLTRTDLLHLRDLFNVILPHEMKTTVSQALAQTQQRELDEAKLWQKLISVFKEAKIPLDDDAPDFVVSTVGVPTIGVFELSYEHDEYEADDA